MILSAALSLKQVFPDSSCPDISINSIASLDDSTDNDLVFVFKGNKPIQLDDISYKLCVLDSSLSVEIPAKCENVIVVPNARLVLARLLQFIDKHFLITFRPEDYVVSSLADIHPTATIEDRVFIGPFCHIGENVVIKKGAILKSGVHVNKNSVIGAKCYIDANTVIHSSVTLGNNVQIGSNTTIGSPGFGFERDASSWQHLAHVSGVSIGDNCFIGSNVAIDAGILKPTQIDNDVIVDNLVQIAHHVKIGSFTAVAGCVGIAGSAEIGENCLIGGGACINGHIKITNGTVVTGMTMVTAHISTPGVYSSGIPANSNSQWKKNAASFSHLAQLRKDISKIKKELLDR